MTALRKVASGTAAAAAVVLLSGAAIGTLYLARGPTASWPGPRVADALPLDELPGHDAVNLFVFLFVWTVAALFLAGVARWGGLDRLTAAVALTGAVAAFVYLVTGVSLYIVRGADLSMILRGPARVRAVYVPPVLAGAAGALLGRQKRHRVPWPGVLAVLVAGAGALDVLSAITPEVRGRLAVLERFAPRPLPPLASSAVVPVGLLLVLMARGLARRKRRAWAGAAWLLAASSALHLLKGLDYEEATVTALLALTLVAVRAEFPVRGDPEATPRLLARAGLLTGAIYAYGLGALWVNRALADRPYSLGFALAETSRALVGLTVGGSPHLAGTFGGWFPRSVLLLGAVAVADLGRSWLGPWRYRPSRDRETCQAVRSLVAEWGTDTLSPFVLRSDCSYFMGSARRSVLAYTVVAGVALLSGDPVGPPDAVARLLAEFIEFARARDWRITVIGASDRWLDLYGARGLRWVYHGDEAVIETERFSLEGRPVRKVRQAVHRLERAGYRWEALGADAVDADLRARFESIVRDWRGHRPQRGFVMAFESPLDPGGAEAIYFVGRDPEGVPRGFLQFAVCRAGSALSLSCMPKRRDTPNGFNEWLVTRAVFWARDHGYRAVSLNFAPFAALLSPGARLSLLERLERESLMAVKAALRLQLDNLLMFCGQFQPSWRPRYVVFERWVDLPRVGLAALTAEGYLPFRARRTA
jgi:lysyl-tRNA synthetase class 2